MDWESFGPGRAEPRNDIEFQIKRDLVRGKHAPSARRR